MTSSVHSANPVPKPGSALALSEIERRKKRLMDILSKGLPTLPQYVMDLNALLTSSSVDLKKVGKVVRTDPSLSAQVLRLCNSALFGLRRRVVSVEQAIVFLGTDRMRTLVLTCSLMQFAGKHMPMDQVLKLWQHCFLCALLSERIAQKTDYFEKEQAYLGGLLHDIGQLPLWILVIEETGKSRALPPENWCDNVILEREYFGMDHCKVGRWMAVAWNFMPSFVDVFEFHHSPERAQHDPYLVGIVGLADHFLSTQTQEEPLPIPPEEATHLESLPAPDLPPSEVNAATVVHPFLPQLAESECQEVLDMLQTEYIHLLPLVQLGLATATGTGTTGNKI